MFLSSFLDRHWLILDIPSAVQVGDAHCQRRAALHSKYTRVLPSIAWTVSKTKLHRFLPDYNGFYRVSTVFYRVLPGFTGFYRVLPGFTGFYRALWEVTGFFVGSTDLQRCPEIGRGGVLEGELFEEVANALLEVVRFHKVFQHFQHRRALAVRYPAVVNPKKKTRID